MDSQHVSAQFDQSRGLARRDGAHGNHVLIVGIGRNGLDRCRNCQRPHFRHQCGSGDLGTHHAAVQSDRPAGEEGRQSLISARIGQPGKTAFRMHGNPDDGQHETVGSIGDMLTEEVSTVKDMAVVGEDQRVVRGTIQFRFNDAVVVVELIAHRPSN